MTSEPNKEIKKEEALPEKDLKCQKQRDEYLAGWQRARADFLNYKKEEIERFKNIIDIANEEMVLKILPLLDSFYLAEKNLDTNLQENSYVKGILQIKAQFEDFLKSQEVKPIETLGKKFDPQFQEVVEGIEVKNQEPGIVVEEIQKGYLIQERLLRPAKVKVSK